MYQSLRVHKCSLAVKLYSLSTSSCTVKLTVNVQHTVKCLLIFYRSTLFNRRLLIVEYVSCANCRVTYRFSLRYRYTFLLALFNFFSKQKSFD